MATTDWDLAGSFGSQYPHVFNSLQALVLSMAKYQKNRDKKSFLGRDKGLESYKKFEASLKDTILAMVLDGIVTRNVDAKKCCEELVSVIVAFSEVFPNWQDAYSYASEYFTDTNGDILKSAEDRVRDILRE